MKNKKAQEKKMMNWLLALIIFAVLVGLLFTKFIPWLNSTSTDAIAKTSDFDYDGEYDTAGDKSPCIAGGTTVETSIGLEYEFMSYDQFDATKCDASKQPGWSTDPYRKYFVLEQRVPLVDETKKVCVLTWDSCEKAREAYYEAKIQEKKEDKG